MSSGVRVLRLAERGAAASVVVGLTHHPKLELHGDRAIEATLTDGGGEGGAWREPTIDDDPVHKIRSICIVILHSHHELKLALNYSSYLNWSFNDAKNIMQLTGQLLVLVKTIGFETLEPAMFWPSGKVRLVAEKWLPAVPALP